MNYIVIDLEFNQPFNFKTGRPAEPNVGCPFEIVQIGMVKLNERLEIVGRKNYFVKPRLYKKIHPFVARMTGFNEATFKNERSFEQVFKPFSRFIGREKAVFCTWGKDDVRELYRNALFYGLNCRKLPKRFIDVQKLVGRHLGNGKNNVGLKSAVEALGIDAQLPFHDALSDAVYAGELFKIVGAAISRSKLSKRYVQKVDVRKIRDEIAGAVR